MTTFLTIKSFLKIDGTHRLGDLVPKWNELPQKQEQRRGTTSVVVLVAGSQSLLLPLKEALVPRHGTSGTRKTDLTAKQIP